MHDDGLPNTRCARARAGAAGRAARRAEIRGPAKRTVARTAQPLSSIPLRTLLFLLLSGLATGASWLCYYRALKLGQVSQAAPLDKLSVPLVALLGVVLLGESLSIWNWLGIGMIAGGTVLVGLKA